MLTLLKEYRVNNNKHESENVIHGGMSRDKYVYIRTVLYISWHISLV